MSRRVLLVPLVVLGLACVLGGCKRKTPEMEPEPSKAAEPGADTLQERGLMTGLSAGELEALGAGPAGEGEGEGEGEGDGEGEGAEEPVEEITHQDPDFSLGQVDDIQRLRLFADGFKRLRPGERALAFHLVQAIQAGRDIAFDQIHADMLEVRRLVEDVLANLAGRDLEVEGALQAYLQALGLHLGAYDQLSLRKFVLALPFERFAVAAQNAYAAGAEFELDRSEPLEAKLSRLRPHMFDADFEPELLAGELQTGEDLLSRSRLNIYQGVRLRDLRGFEEGHPQNSRLLRVDGGLVEEVYRAGDKRQKIAPGRYASELRRVIQRLHAAMTTAPKDGRRMLSGLIEHFRTGEGAAFDAPLQAMRSGSREVELCIGFLDTGLDPRGVKGLFAGLVGFKDGASTSKLQSIARHLQSFEEAMPWPEEYRQRWNGEIEVVALTLLHAGGRLGPRLRLGYRLEAEQRGSAGRGPAKALLFTNALEAYRRAALRPLVEQLAPPELRARLLATLEQAVFLRAALGQVVGCALGQQHAEARALLGPALPVLQALKAELSSLWLLPHPKLAELGLAGGAEPVEAAYQLAVLEALVAEALASAALADPAARARRIWVRHALEVSRAVRLEEKDGAVWVRLEGVDALRAGLGKLLARVERILTHADRRAALTLLARFQEPPALPGLAMLGERARAAGLRRHLAVVYPHLVSILGENGRVVDALATHDETFEQQLLRLAKP